MCACQQRQQQQHVQHNQRRCASAARVACPPPPGPSAERTSSSPGHRQQASTPRLHPTRARPSAPRPDSGGCRLPGKWRRTRLLYSLSNLWASWSKVWVMAVLLARQSTECGAPTGGTLHSPTLKPSGFQPTCGRRQQRGSGLSGEEGEEHGGGWPPRGQARGLHVASASPTLRTPPRPCAPAQPAALTLRSSVRGLGGSAPSAASA